MVKRSRRNRRMGEGSVVKKLMNLCVSETEERKHGEGAGV